MARYPRSIGRSGRGTVGDHKMQLPFPNASQMCRRWRTWPTRLDVPGDAPHRKASCMWPRGSVGRARRNSGQSKSIFLRAGRVAIEHMTSDPLSCLVIRQHCLARCLIVPSTLSCVFYGAVGSTSYGICTCVCVCGFCSALLLVVLVYCSEWPFFFFFPHVSQACRIIGQTKCPNGIRMVLL